MAKPTRIVLGGFGNIGQQIAGKLTSPEERGIEIVAIAARDKEKARKAAAGFGLTVPIISADEALTRSSWSARPSTGFATSSSRHCGPGDM